MIRNYLFHTIHTLVTRYPFWVIGISIIAAAVLGIYGSIYMEMITDQDKLLSEDLEYHRSYEDFKRRFGDLEFLYVVIEGGDDAQKILFADRLAEQLENSPDIDRVVYKFDRSWIKPFSLYYAPQDEIDRLQTEIQSNIDNLQELKDTPTADHILYSVSQSLSQQQEEKTTELHSGDLDVFLRALKGEHDPALDELQRFQREINEEFDHAVDYQWLTDRQYLLMLIMPKKDFATLSVIEKPIQHIRSSIDALESELPMIKAGLTGRPALQADEMSTTNTDMARSSIIAFIGVFILFIIFFREIIRPLLTIIALLIALGWTYGFVALTLGHLNLLSLVFALVLIGLGVDFGIHLLHRYQEELEKSKVSSKAVLGALFGVGGGIITGALTSSVAFLLALLTDFLGLAELGYVAGSGIVLCLLSMLVTLPAFLYTYDRHFRKAEHVTESVQITGLRHISTKPKTMVLFIFVITACLLPQAMHVKFDDNLLKLQAEGLESVEYEHILLDNTDESTWFCAYLRDSVDEIRSVSNELMTKPSVASVSSIADVLPKEADIRQQQLSTIHNTVQPIIEKQYPYSPNPNIYHDVKRQLDGLFLLIDQQKTMMEEMQSNPNLPSEQLQQMQEAQQNQPEIDETHLEQLKELRDLLSGSKEDVEQRLINANQSLLENPRNALQTIARYTSVNPPGLDDISEDIKSLYVGINGSLLLMAFPKYNIWETHYMSEFIADVRDVAPDVTGTPIQVYESSFLMRDAFTTVGVYSMIAVAFFVFFDFLSLKALFFVMMPLILGVLWLVEIMGFFGVHLNLANFFAIPILIGIGVDNAVHLYHRYEETGDIEKALSTTGTTLTLTTLTTITGFGSLIFASHKGLASLGMLMAMGSATCWFACVIFMPVLIQSFKRD
jgi:hopanoid biosynthesis associated RND transporter like protein HpnN